jgi:hypothetical protein
MHMGPRELKQEAGVASAAAQWIILDGAMTSDWADSLCSVLGVEDSARAFRSTEVLDGEYLAVPPSAKVLIETASLQNCSPATISRCGLVVVSDALCDWKALLAAFTSNLPTRVRPWAEHVFAWSSKIAGFGVDFALKCNPKHTYLGNLDKRHLWKNQLVSNFIRVAESLIAEFADVPVQHLVATDTAQMKSLASRLTYADGRGLDDTTVPITDHDGFAQMSQMLAPPGVMLKQPTAVSQLQSVLTLAGIWAFGTLSRLERDRNDFDQALNTLLSRLRREELADQWVDKLPRTGSCVDWFYSLESHRWSQGKFDENSVRLRADDPGALLHPSPCDRFLVTMPVHRLQPIRAVLGRMIAARQPVVLFGHRDRARNVVVSTINRLDRVRYTASTQSFSASTTIADVQSHLELRLQSHALGLLTPSGSRQLVYFVEDLRCVASSNESVQPAVELLRQLLEQGGWYLPETGSDSLTRAKATGGTFSCREDLKRALMFQSVLRVHMVATGSAHENNLVDLGRSQCLLTGNRMATLQLMDLSEGSVSRVLAVLIRPILLYDKGMNQEVAAMSGAIAAASAAMISAVRRQPEFQRSPLNPHYIFDVNTLAQITKGIVAASAVEVDSSMAMVRLWHHECTSIFGDRMQISEHRVLLRSIITTVMVDRFGAPFPTVRVDPEVNLGETLSEHPDEDAKYSDPDGVEDGPSAVEQRAQFKQRSSLERLGAILLRLRSGIMRSKFLHWRAEVWIASGVQSPGLCRGDMFFCPALLSLAHDEVAGSEPNVAVREASVHAVCSDLGSYYARFNSKRKGAPLATFECSVLHVVHIARILSSRGGHMFLYGNQGTGKATATKLASLVLRVQCEVVALGSTGCSRATWHETVANVMLSVASIHKPVVLLIDGAQSAREWLLRECYELVRNGSVQGVMHGAAYQATLDTALQLLQQTRLRQEAEISLAGSLPAYSTNIDEGAAASVSLEDLCRLCRNSVRVVVNFQSAEGDTGLLDQAAHHPRASTQALHLLLEQCVVKWFAPWPVGALKKIAKSALGRALAAGATEKRRLAAVKSRGEEEVRVQEQNDLNNTAEHAGVAVDHARTHGQQGAVPSAAAISGLAIAGILRSIPPGRDCNELTNAVGNQLVYMHCSMGKGSPGLVKAAMAAYVRLVLRLPAALEKRYELHRSGADKVNSIENRQTEVQESLATVEPRLEEKRAELSTLKKKLADYTENAKQLRQNVLDMEHDAKAMELALGSLKENLQKNITQVDNLLIAAVKGVKKMKPRDIDELRKSRKPLPKVKVCIAALCIMLGIQPAALVKAELTPTQEVDIYWDAGKKVLSDPKSLVLGMVKYDKNKIPRAIMEKINSKMYLGNTSFTPKDLKAVSPACEAICRWVRAVCAFNAGLETNKPLRLAIKKKESSLTKAMKQLAKERKRVVDTGVEVVDASERITEIARGIEELEKASRRWVHEVDEFAILAKALQAQRGVWLSSLDRLKQCVVTVHGDLVMLAGAITFLGLSGPKERTHYLKKWAVNMRTSSELSILQTSWVDRSDQVQSKVQPRLNHIVFGLSLLQAVDPEELLLWSRGGIQGSGFTLEGAIVVQEAIAGGCVPVIIDVHGVAAGWIKKVHEFDDLQHAQHCDDDLQKVLSNAAERRNPALVRLVGDPTIALQVISEILDSVRCAERLRLYLVTESVSPRATWHHGDTDSIEEVDPLHVIRGASRVSPLGNIVAAAAAVIGGVRFMPVLFSTVEPSMEDVVSTVSKAVVQHTAPQIDVKVQAARIALVEAEKNIKEHREVQLGDFVAAAAAHRGDFIAHFREESERGSVLKRAVFEARDLLVKALEMQSLQDTLVRRLGALFQVTITLGRADPVFSTSLSQFAEFVKAVVQSERPPKDSVTSAETIYATIAAAVTARFLQRWSSAVPICDHPLLYLSTFLRLQLEDAPSVGRVSSAEVDSKEEEVRFIVSIAGRSEALQHGGEQPKAQVEWLSSVAWQMIKAAESRVFALSGISAHFVTNSEKWQAFFASTNLLSERTPNGWPLSVLQRVLLVACVTPRLLPQLLRKEILPLLQGTGVTPSQSSPPLEDAVRRSRSATPILVLMAHNEASDCDAVQAIIRLCVAQRRRIITSTFAGNQGIATLAGDGTASSMPDTKGALLGVADAVKKGAEEGSWVILRQYDRASKHHATALHSICDLLEAPTTRGNCRVWVVVRTLQPNQANKIVSQRTVDMLPLTVAHRSIRVAASAFAGPENVVASAYAAVKFPCGPDICAGPGGGTGLDAAKAKHRASRQPLMALCFMHATLHRRRVLLAPLGARHAGYFFESDIEAVMRTIGAWTERAESVIDEDDHFHWAAHVLGTMYASQVLDRSCRRSTAGFVVDALQREYPAASAPRPAASKTAPKSAKRSGKKQSGGDRAKEGDVSAEQKLAVRQIVSAAAAAYTESLLAEQNCGRRLGISAHELHESSAERGKLLLRRAAEGFATGLRSGARSDVLHKMLQTLLAEVPYPIPTATLSRLELNESSSAHNLVLLHEIETINTLITFVRDSIEKTLSIYSVDSDCQDATVASQNLVQEVAQAVRNGRVPTVWLDETAHGQSDATWKLPKWLDHLKKRVTYFLSASEQKPTTAWIGAYTRPEAFFASILTDFAAITRKSLDTVSIKFLGVLNSAVSQEGAEHGHTASSGIFRVSGLNLDGASWESSVSGGHMVPVTERLPGAAKTTTHPACPLPTVMLQCVSNRKDAKASKKSWRSLSDELIRASIRSIAQKRAKKRAELAASMPGGGRRLVPAGNAEPSKEEVDEELNWFSCPVYSTELSNVPLFCLRLPTEVPPEVWVRRSVSLICRSEC